MGVLGVGEGDWRIEVPVCERVCANVCVVYMCVCERERERERDRETERQRKREIIIICLEQSKIFLLSKQARAKLVADGKRRPHFIIYLS